MAQGEPRLCRTVVIQSMRVNRPVLLRLGALLLVAPAGVLLGGGSGLNVAVVVNQASTNSVQVGNYYCEQRQVPPQNLVRIVWTGGSIEWARTQFVSTLVAPLNAALAARQLTNQIDYVLLSTDIPYRVTETNGANSTTSALFYGFKADGSASPPSCSLPSASANAYAGSEDIFRNVTQFSTNTNSFLVMMIAATNLVQAKLFVDHGVAGDGTFPTQTVVLGKSTDTARNIRYPLFDNAIFNTRLRGNYLMERTNTDTPNIFGPILGYENGRQIYGIAANTFIPGAMADNLTSYGGLLFENPIHTTALDFMIAGAVGSYGTVVEPCAYLQKFPTPQNYFYQARGFSLAECYYQSITNPYQGLLVGEPLAAPFAQPAEGFWSNPSADALLSGTTNLTLEFIPSDADHPVHQVDLFLDGLWVQTLTNIAPSRFNVLNVTINGRSMDYTVPNNATIKSVTSGLATVLNSASNTNVTKVRAIAHGDRIELQSFLLGRSGSEVSISVSSSRGSAGAVTTFIAASGTNFLDTAASGIRGFQIKNAPILGSYLQCVVTKTNSTTVTVTVTNNDSGATLAQFTQQLLDAINTNTDLQSPDGLIVEDLISYTIPPNTPTTEFNLRARAEGWDAAQIQADVNGSLSISPLGNEELDENLADLQPRNHLYITAGVTNLLLTFPFNTTTQADGHHELTAVAYEGSHVQTQTRVTQNVRIQNTPLAATFACTPCGSNTAVEATIQFSVVANTNNVSRIELFSTGGSLGVVSNQSSASFFVAGTNLNIGLHPFYAFVTRSDGKQYRTETKWIRLVGNESPFPLSIAAPPPAIAWPAVAGRRYDVLSADIVTNSFQMRETVVPATAAGQWTDTNAAPTQRYYRVRSLP